MDATPIVTALVSGSIGVAGTLLGVRSSGKGERERTLAVQAHERDLRREQVRRETYVAFLTALDEFLWAAYDVHDTPDGPQRQVTVEALQARLRQLDKFNHHVQLVGVVAVAALARRAVDFAAVDMRPAARQRAANWEDVVHRLVEFERTFEAAVRADLGLAD